jgi:hypothetical protein
MVRHKTFKSGVDTQTHYDAINLMWYAKKVTVLCYGMKYEVSVTFYQIQELEQAQERLQCFCFREIPNKASPPYTPPDQATRSPTTPVPGVSRVLLRKQDLTTELPIICSAAEELTSLTLKVTSYLYNLLMYNGDIQHTDIPPAFYEESNTANMSDIERSSRRIFKKLVFDLTKGLVNEAYGLTRENPCALWDWPAFSCKRNNPLPRSKEILQEVVLKQVLDLFGFVPKVYKEKHVIQWSHKKRDYVDEILMKECHEEESAWTDYTEDEVTVKNEVALRLLDSLLDETGKVISDIRKAKLQK